MSEDNLLVFRKKLKLIAFNVNNPNYNSEAIVAHFEKSPNYSDWWNHFPGIFIIRSDLRPDAITDDLQSAFDPPPAWICVTFEQETSSARLDERAWRWILDMPDSELDELFGAARKIKS